MKAMSFARRVFVLVGSRLGCGLASYSGGSFGGRCSRVALALLSVCALLGGCSEPAKPRPNVILITVDTLRADHLGCYGYERDTSPNLDAFAKESARFERAYSMAPFTAPSHASLFTGLHTPSHGVYYWGHKVDAGASTLAERFAGAGWRTGAFYNHPSIESCDLQRGFQHAEARYYEPAEDSIDALLGWVEREPGKPFASWLHLWDVHRPYGWRDWNELPAEVKSKVQRRELTFAYEEQRYGAPTELAVGRGEQFYNVPEPRQRKPIGFAGKQRVLDERDWQFVADRYDGGVRYADQALGRLFAELKRRGLWDNTVIVITSDHGEALLEREPCWFTHDPFLYEETLHVPLFVRVPGGAGSGRAVPDLARGIDVLPTLLELADLPGAGLQGRSLLPLLRGESLPPALLWAQTQTHSAKESARRTKPGEDWLEPRECISDGRWKIVIDYEKLAADKTTGVALYDLQSDPRELKNSAHTPEGLPHVQRLMKAADEFRKAQRAGSEKGALTDAQRRLLDSLGY
jgi:arylsulfatase